MFKKNINSELVELNRTFHEVVLSAANTNDVEQDRLVRHGNCLTWADLVQKYRVVILSEAGTGKTVELQRTAMKLREQCKNAFFLRLEHIADDFEEAFEVGTYNDFEAWLSSNNEGYMFLDSVDEARLRHPSDFERAIRKLGVRLAAAHQRVHVVMTSRIHAWRPKTDLDHFARHLPYDLSRTSSGTNSQQITDNRSRLQLSEGNNAEKDKHSGFKVVAIDDLESGQIKTFVSWKGVKSVEAFLEAVERGDAWSFTARPQDLEELASFWNANGKIGTRFEIIRSSIKRRLTERDQDRADSYPIAQTRAEQGARLIAAAATLTHEPTIRVPDGAANSIGISITDVLPDWNDTDRTTLLSRPIFSEAIYGTVRFHHRSVREFLTAEWIAELLKSQTSRRKIESLLFRNQYGLDVVLPTMRPILPWLALLDDKISNCLCQIAPEILLEGGDPSKLPLDSRRTILRKVCEGSGSITFHAAVQRFANEDLVPDVKELIAAYADNDDLVAFLLRMIWIGALKGGLPEARAFASSSTCAKYTRIVAIRAVRAVGSKEDFNELRIRIVGSGTDLDREYLAELVYGLESSIVNTAWLLACLARAGAQHPHRTDPLADAVMTFVGYTDVEFLPDLVFGFSKLLETPPVFEGHSCEISQTFIWLLEPAVRAVKRLIEARHPACLATESLEVLRKFPNASQHHNEGSKDSELEFSRSVPMWPELNHASFWNAVKKTRGNRQRKNSKKVTEFWQVSDAFWRFEKTDFEYALKQIAVQTLPDDRLVALSLAFRIYVMGGRNRKQRYALKKATSHDKALADRLTTYLTPAPQGRQQWKQMQSRRKRQAEEFKERQTRNREEWCRALRLNAAMLRNNGLPTGQLSNYQEYLFERMREKDRESNRWTNGDWNCLIDEFGEEVALAYRDGAIQFWRNYVPELRSEGAPSNSRPFAVLFGLTGLQIDATETAEWSKSLNSDEVALACRYASHELNGFPTWFPPLLIQHEASVTEFLIKEIRFELETETPGVDSLYVLYDLSTSGQWAWNSLASEVHLILRDVNPANDSNFSCLLNILLGSAIPDAEIAALAQSKCHDPKSPDRAAFWFAVWVGVDPEVAIPALTKMLKKLATKTRTTFAMQFVTRLVGSNRGEFWVSRHAFRTPKHLKALYLLMHQHIRAKEDTRRAGQGVYSPNLRDYAQDARNILAELLRNIPGKEAYIALREIADSHPEEAYRPWFTLSAKAKAESDADCEAWSAEQVREFHGSLEFTPTNHRDLAELVRLRLLDLKDDLENGDSSIANILQPVKLETDMRKFVGHELREKANGRYSIPQEEEFADAKRADLRFHGSGFDAPVPCEMKLADKWTGPELIERLENQLCRDYLRDNRSSRGFFVLFFQGKKKRWQLPAAKGTADATGLLKALENHWVAIAANFPGIDQVEVIGIDLTKRRQ